MEGELLGAINPFSSGKSLGIDGIPIGVYKTFFINPFSSGKSPRINGIPIVVYKTFSHKSKKSWHLLSSLSFGQYYETHKKKQDPQGHYKYPAYMKHWRPLTLLCCDTCILSNCAALRIKIIIGDKIWWQTGIMVLYFTIVKMKKESVEKAFN